MRKIISNVVFDNITYEPVLNISVKEEGKVPVAYKADTVAIGKYGSLTPAEQLRIVECNNTLLNNNQPRMTEEETKWFLNGPKTPEEALAGTTRRNLNA